MKKHYSHLTTNLHILSLCVCVCVCCSFACVHTCCTCLSCTLLKAVKLYARLLQQHDSKSGLNTLLESTQRHLWMHKMYKLYIYNWQQIVSINTINLYSMLAYWEIHCASNISPHFMSFFKLPYPLMEAGSYTVIHFIWISHMSYSASNSCLDRSCARKTTTS